MPLQRLADSSLMWHKQCSRLARLFKFLVNRNAQQQQRTVSLLTRMFAPFGLQESDANMARLQAAVLAVALFGLLAVATAGAAESAPMSSSSLDNMSGTAAAMQRHTRRAANWLLTRSPALQHLAQCHVPFSVFIRPI